MATSIKADGDLDLGFNSVLVDAKKCFDAQMLLDSFEEQLDLPTAFVKLRDGQGWKFEIVGEEAEALVVWFVVKPDVT